MSRIPFLMNESLTQFLTHLSRAKTLGQKLKTLVRFRPSMLAPIVGLEKGLTDQTCGMGMGVTAELLAKEFGITRKEQDRLALRSHRLANAATESGRFAEEIIPVPIAPDYAAVQAVDDGIRPNQSMEALAALNPYFDRVAGTVTPGNASQLTDGAGAVLIMAESKAKSMGIKPMGYLRDYSVAALEGERMGLGPVFAISRLMRKTGLSLDDFGLIELNEAFAAQALACEKALASDAFAQERLGRDRAVGALNWDRVNVNGGAIALGHPVGSSGTRLVVTILKEMAHRNVNLGLVTLCVGGGQGVALAMELS